MSTQIDSTSKEPNLLDLTRDLAELTRMNEGESGLSPLLRRGLDWLSQVAPYDLACVFRLEDGELALQEMRGSLSRPELAQHRLSLAAFPSIRDAIELRRAQAFTEDQHSHGDGDPFDGVLDLPPGHSCMVVPIVAGEEVFGVLTLDRIQCEVYAPQMVSLVEIYVRILALVIRSQEREERLLRIATQHREIAEGLQQRMQSRSAHVGVLEDSKEPLVRALAERARLLAQTQTPVLIQGETGTGKERLAMAVHRWSPRKSAPFVTVNCAAIPQNLIESELFGHERGSFTGATRERPGLFRTANGGTLFLDEIGDLSLDLQAKLLRAVQSGEFQPVGSDRTVRVDVRIVAATHVDLALAVQKGLFREDLYYRLAVFPLELPPLRDRKADIGALALHLLTDIAERHGGRVKGLTKDAEDMLSRCEWPGNIRQLGNALERAFIVSQTSMLEAGDFTELVESSSSASNLLGKGQPSHLKSFGSLEENERLYIEAVLEHTHGKIYGQNGAAKILELAPSTLQSKMKKLGIRYTQSR